jgi:hypothetical protein
MAHIRVVPWLAAALLWGCGSPIREKAELTKTLTAGAVPSSHSDAASFRIDAATVPMPQIRVVGAQGGAATLTLNPVGVAVGLAGGGLLFDTRYEAFSLDGLQHLHGEVSVLANLEYTPKAAEPADLDFSVGLVGKVELSGAYWDELRLNVSVKTRLSELKVHEGELRLRLVGSVETRQQRFEFADEEVQVSWSELLAGR